MKPSKPKLCIYCGKPADTVDHIPPKALVPAPARNNIITVPACRACNNGFSKDDEFLMGLSVLDGAQFTQDAGEVSERVVRWLEKPHKKGQFFGVMKELRPIVLSGYRGKTTETMSFQMDSERLLRQCDRFIRALHYDMRRELLPEGFICISAHPEDPALAEFRAKCRELLSDRPLHTVGNDTFRYRFRGYAPQMPNHYHFELVFYDSLRVFGMITDRPPDFELKPQKRSTPRERAKLRRSRKGPKA
jgi:hypothetical protein